MQRFALVLEYRIQRHTEETSGAGETEKVREDPPAAGLCDERRDRGELCRCCSASTREVEVDRTERHHSGRKRHVTRAHFTVQKPLGKQRTQSNADRKER